MQPAPSLAVAFVPTIAPERLVTAARLTEDVGLDTLWLWEDCFKQSGLACAAVALAVTQRIRVGIGLMPVPLRNVALTAMEVATLTRIYPERFVPGVGHGVQDWMGQAGVRVSSPMTLLREYIVALRILLSGKRATLAGRYVKLDRVRLDWPLPTPPPLLVGGEGPRTLALAGELGDGVLLAGGLTADEVRAASETATAAVPDGARLRPDAPFERVVDLVVAPDGSDGMARLAAHFERMGIKLSAAHGTIRQAWYAAEKVREFAAAGATLVVFRPTDDDTDLDAVIRLAGEVKALLT